MRLLRLLLAFCCATPLAAQSALLADASVRSTPGGSVIALLKEGTTVTVGPTRNGAVYITFTGWIDGTRLGGERDSFPAHLTGNIAMRLRSAPSMRGVIMGEVRPLAGVFTQGKQASWVNIRRSGWVDAKAVARNGAPAAEPPRAETKAAPPRAETKAAPANTKAAPVNKKAPTSATKVPATAAKTAPAPANRVAPAAVRPPEPARTVATAKPTGAAPTAAADTAAPDPSAIELLPEGVLRVARTAVARNAPNGAVVGQIGGGTYVVPLARSRGWVRIRAELWVPERDVVPADTSFGASLSAADLRADPEGTRGKTVRWEVQVLALQYADPLRRDLAKDEPYFLAKGPGSEDQLLYLAIPPSLLSEARSTQALTRLLVTARVRTGRSQPVGIPILDVISFSRQ
ncbi:MAG: hypothetical protein FJ363_05700 [Gemmatimonadetes bacterium]|nr:hypothetical protein [Gemmatimonadota bacterium]